jgi:hypothetical protein
MNMSTTSFEERRSQKYKRFVYNGANCAQRSDMITHTPIGSIISSDLPMSFSMTNTGTGAMENVYRNITESRDMITHFRGGQIILDQGMIAWIRRKHDNNMADMMAPFRIYALLCSKNNSNYVPVAARVFFVVRV